jgi:hypothetical protein
MFHRTISNIWRQRRGKAFSQVIISSHVSCREYLVSHA